MVLYDETIYKIKHSAFDREYKRVEPYKTRRPLTADLNKRIEYKESLVRTYNELIVFFSPFEKTAPLEEKLDIQTIIVEHLKKLKEAFYILRLNYTFGKGIFETIDLNKITDDNATQTDIFENISQLTPESQANKNLNTSIIHNNSHLDNGTNNNTVNMTQTTQEFMSYAKAIINYQYDGDPLALDSFVDAIKLLDGLTADNNKQNLVNYVMTKLVGDAREAIEDRPQNAQDIIDDLEEAIKPHPSKVIEGKLLSLRADKTSLFKFSEQAEELAEQYRRSLTKEGYSKDKAKELAIEKTVDLCRRSARSERVKAIMDATAFNDPKDVIAKMIISINNMKLDREATQTKQKYGNNQNRNSNNRNSNGNGNFNRNFNNNRNSNASNSQNGNYNRQNSNRNGNSSNRNGNFNRNGNSRGNHNGYNSRTFTNGGNQGYRNEQTVRSFSGNEINPGNGGQTAEQASQ